MDDNKHNTSDNSVLLYNTQNIDAEVLKSGFSIRKREYDRIWKDIQNSDMTHPETHYLIQGVRGAGKTTLLSRLAYEVAADEKLSEWLVPILLNEEEYGILSLFTFWLRIAEKLAEQNPNLYADLFEQISNLDDSAEAAWDLIQNSLDENKQKIIVFVDNLGELFKDFDEIEHAQLRKVLSLHSQIRLVGGSSQLLEAHFDVSEPFYQFFKLVNLRPINEMEMHELLRSLAKQTSEDAVNTIEKIITEHPERIEAVRRLTDGVPRTIVLLFQIIMEGAKESSYAYLEETIDKTTPLYKHRMDDLSRQQKAIVHTIAMNWDAMSTKEIAEQTRLPSKTVSAQLVKLQQQWIVDKIGTNTKNHLYIVKERFFNIWYLMRYGNQTDKRRVLWLTRFLESWYDSDELNMKLVEIATPYVNLDKAEGFKLQRTKEVYINALLASGFVDDSFKIGVNKVLEPYYPNLINDDSTEEFLRRFSTVLREWDESNGASRQKELAELFELSVSVTIYLACLDFFSTYLEKDEKLKNIILNKLFEKTSKGSLSNLFFLFRIMESDNKIINELGEMLSEDWDFNEEVEEALFGLFIFKIHIKLWFDDFESFYEDINILERSVDLNNIESPLDLKFLERFLILLLKKGQLEIIYSWMHEFEQMRERFKPIYYATVSLLKDERHQEYLRMGSELKGTVDEILQKVEEYRFKYA